MGVSKQNKKYLLDFAMKSNSLHDLLEILSNICENFDLLYLNSRTNHFRYFQFTFFGLMVKAKGLLEIMVFRVDFLKKHLDEFNKIYLGLIRLKKNIETTYNLVEKNKMAESINKIIELNKEYQYLFEKINKLLDEIISNKGFF